MQEPSCEPPAASGPSALLLAATEEALPSVRAIIEAPDLLPQQALGALSFVAEVLNRILVNLNDPSSLAKFGRVKVAALRKRLTRRPELAEAILLKAGFVQASEYLEWGPETPEVLASSLAVLALAARLQEVAKTAEGLRNFARQPIDANIGSAQVLALTYGGCHLLERPLPSDGSGGYRGGPQTAGGVEGALVRRQWLAERLPRFVALLDESPTLFEPAAREKALMRAVTRAINEDRTSKGLERLCHVSWLQELAQLAANAALLALRNPGLLDLQVPTQATEPDLEPPSEVCSAGDSTGDIFTTIPKAKPKALEAGPAGEVVKVLLQCIPACRLGFDAHPMSELLRLSEAPAFFTMSLKDKPFEVSLEALTKRTISDWLAQPETAEVLLRPTVATLGMGCCVDIGNDDKAILFAVVA